MELEKTEGINPIEFESWLTGPTGARFALYPKAGFHTEEEVKVAKAYLFRNRDVVSLQVRWVHPKDNTPHPEKIPDYLIIKNLQKELGQANSYIEELELKIQDLKKELGKANDITNISSAEKHEIKREILYMQKNKEKKELEKTIQKLRKDKEDLIIRLNQKTNP